MSIKTNILVCKAKLLKDISEIKSMDPYFIAKCSNNQSFTSKKRKHEGKYPMWNEYFTFNTNINDNIIIEVRHSNELIGSCSHKITEQSFTIFEGDLSLVCGTSFVGSLYVKIECNNKEDKMNSNLIYSDNNLNLMYPRNNDVNNQLNLLIPNNNINNFNLNNQTNDNKNFSLINDNSNYLYGNIDISKSINLFQNNSNEIISNNQINNNVGNNNLNTSKIQKRGSNLINNIIKDQSKEEIQFPSINDLNINEFNNNFENNELYNKMFKLDKRGSKLVTSSSIVNQNEIKNSSFVNNNNNNNNHYKDHNVIKCKVYSNLKSNYEINFSKINNLNKDSWWTFLNNNKYPYYFQHAGSRIYKFEFSDETFVEMINFSKIVFPFNYKTTEISGNGIYLIGGELNGFTTDTLLLYDIINNNFSYKASMNNRRHSCACISINKTIYVFGGICDGEILSKSESYSSLNNSWINLNDLPFPLHSHQVIAKDNDKIYIICGSSSDKMNDNIIVFDINQNLYNKLQIRIQEPVKNFISFFVNDDCIIILGGDTSENFSDKVYNINLRNNDVIPLENLESSGFFLMPNYYFNEAIYCFSINDYDVTNIPNVMKYHLDLPGLIYT